LLAGGIFALDGSLLAHTLIWEFLCLLNDTVSYVGYTAWDGRMIKTFLTAEVICDGREFA
jgi:hypothetical protein